MKIFSSLICILNFFPHPCFPLCYLLGAFPLLVLAMEATPAASIFPSSRVLRQQGKYLASPKLILSAAASQTAP